MTDKNSKEKREVQRCFQTTELGKAVLEHLDKNYWSETEKKLCDDKRKPASFSQFLADKAQHEKEKGEWELLLQQRISYYLGRTAKLENEIAELKKKIDNLFWKRRCNEMVDEIAELKRDYERVCKCNKERFDEIAELKKKIEELKRQIGNQTPSWAGTL